MQKAENCRGYHYPDKSMQAQRCQLALQISAKDQFFCADLNEQERQGEGQQAEPLAEREVWQERFAVICDSSHDRGHNEQSSYGSEKLSFRSGEIADEHKWAVVMQAPDCETDRCSQKPETAQHDKHLTWAAGARHLHGPLKPSLAHDR